MGSVIYIKNILSKDELNLIWGYMKIFHASNRDYFDFHQTALGETHRYGDPLIESLLLSKKDIFEKNLKKELLPTYTFWRMYNKFSKLDKHKDRSSCEVTISLSVNSDKDWPLFIGNKEYLIQPGDGVLYYGGKLEHWREEYLGDYCGQIFLHYVEKEGIYKDHVYDKRQYLGFKK
jgi:hypothetical protein